MLLDLNVRVSKYGSLGNYYSTAFVVGRVLI
jgi:hypothetical protein